MNAPLFVTPERVRQPGLNALPPNTERYTIAPCGSLALELGAGDALELISPEGLQHAEINAFDGRGRGDPALLGLEANDERRTEAEISACFWEDNRPRSELESCWL